MPSTQFNNFSFRAVGIYLRVNDTFNTAEPVPSQAGFKDDYLIPSLTVNHQGTKPTVKDLMVALITPLQQQCAYFGFYDLPNISTPLIDGMYLSNSQELLQIESATLTYPPAYSTQLEAMCVWQYYLFDTSSGKDVRIPVPNRSSYANMPIQDNIRIIWRPIVTFTSQLKSQQRQAAMEARGIANSPRSLEELQRMSIK